MRVSIVALVVLTAAQPVLADDKPAGAAANGEPVGFSHQGQLEVSLRLAMGLRALAPYHDEFCGDLEPDNSPSPVCTGRAPFSLDLELGYGIARKIDLLLELRIGIEPDFGSSPIDMDGARVFHVSPGARFFFSDSAKTKLFTTAQLVIDASGYKDPSGAGLGTDFGVRNLSGIWIDLDRAYGFYAFVGETATAARWLRFELEAGFGVQGRYR